MASHFGSFASVWYVDGRATGANNGTSWADAWRTLTNINWTAIQPGDTIYLSGGAYGQTYSNCLNIQKDGLPGRPITIRVSQEKGHNGLVTIFTGTNEPAVRVRDWVTLDGARDDSFAATWITNTPNVVLVPTNIGLRLIGMYGVNYTASGPAGMRLLWLEIQNPMDVQGHYGIRINNASPYNVTNNEIAYCWIHNIAQDGINHPGGNIEPSWDDFVVHHCLIEAVGDDALEIGEGWTVHHCILRRTLHLHGHPDGTQVTGNYLRWYNNIVYDWSSSALAVQGKSTNYGPMQVYGNLIYVDDRPCSTTAVEYRWFALPGYSFERAYYRDWVMVNNSICFSGNGSWTVCKRDGYPTNAYFRNFLFANNIVYNSTNWAVTFNWGATADGGGYWWDETDVFFDYNIIGGRAPNAERINWHGTSYSCVSDLTAASIYKSNTAALPIFVNESTYNLGLAAEDTAARGTGTNLTALNLPGLAKDLCGNPRPTEGPWDRGALVYGSSLAFPENGSLTNPFVPLDANLVVWLTFDDMFEEADYIADESGNGNHAWRFGRPEYPTNWPCRVSAGTTPGGRTDMGYCGDFRWYWDGWGLYGRSGDYAGITNVARLTNMATATIALWARYHSSKRIAETNGWWHEQNSTLLSAGTAVGVIGAWDLQRFSTLNWSNCTRFLVITNSPPAGSNSGRFEIVFPDINMAGHGDTTNWHHYAITWSNGVCRGYFDGQLIGTGDISAITTTLTIGRALRLSPYWIGVGCNTHGGTPPLEDEPGNDYPNHGWFNGVMDDVRIYDRALSAAEIYGLYSGQLLPSRPLPPRNLAVK